MDLSKISIGKNPPQEINVVIEITGGSSGMGEATANLLAEKGVRVFCAQRTRSLHEDILVCLLYTSPSPRD